MKAKITADEHAALPEALRVEYVERDGAYFAKIEPVDGLCLENVSGLRSALEKTRAENKALKDRSDAFGDLDPNVAREALAKVGEMSSWTPEQKVKEQIELHGRQLSEKHSAEIKKRTDREAFLFAQLQRNLVERAAMEAIVKKGGRPKLLMPVVTSKLKIVEENGELVTRLVNERGVELVSRKDSSDAPMQVDEYVELLQADPEFEGAFDLETKSGGGTRSSSSKPTPPKGVRRIPRSDQAAINANFEAIAKGEAIVVD